MNWLFQRIYVWYVGIITYKWYEWLHIKPRTCTMVQSGDWHDKNTWDCKKVPRAIDRAILTGGFTLTISKNCKISSLELDNGTIKDTRNVKYFK